MILPPLAEFRAAYEERLKRPEGWLSLAGLHWIAEGRTTVGVSPSADVRLPAGPSLAGVVERDGPKITWTPTAGVPVELTPDKDRVRLDGTTFMPIARGGRIGLRVWHPEAETRTKFAGVRWYPDDPAFRVIAKWVPKPGKLVIVDVLGDRSETPSTGVAEFVLKGKTYRLRPDESGDGLFFVFRDRTSGRGTYGAGRFLSAEKPSDGTVVLDFNRATNPPCAWTPYATCPLPPRENRLNVAITAGERAPVGH